VKRALLLVLAAALLVPVVTSGCQQQTLRALPNLPPLAHVVVDSGDDNTASQRLGYVIQDGTARLDGSLSDDPDNDPIVFVWNFDAVPDDSTMVAEDIYVPEDDPETEDVNEAAYPSFEPDVLGTYRISLVVIDDEEAASTPAIAVIQAVPPSDLSIDLEWNDTRADLDLHLISPDGLYFDMVGDCFSWNPNPDWGDPDLATDNPMLDGDADGEGSAPYREGITLEAPPNGDYEVWVHYYADHAEQLGNTAVPASPQISVRVFDELVDDNAQLSPTDPMMAGDVWKAGVLSWPDRSWAVLNARSDHVSEGGPDYNTLDEGE